MKKIFTLISFLLFGAMGAHAQTDTLLWQDFNIDSTAIWPTFNSGNDTTWVDYDVDLNTDANGLPGNWFWDVGFDGADTLDGCMWSSSWFDVSGRAANYLITPPVTITYADAMLSWKSAPYQTPHYLDGYKVLVSTTDNYEASFTDTIFVAAEDTNPAAGTLLDYSTYNFSAGFVHGADGTYVLPNSARVQTGLQRPLSAALGQYAGQTIYIAFLHDSYDDAFISLDDVLLVENLTVGLNEPVKKQAVKIYPNPVSDKINIDYTLDASANVLIRIFDTKGSVVKEFSKGTQQAGNQKISVNVADLASGVYSVNIIAGDKSTHSNVVINHN